VQRLRRADVRVGSSKVKGVKNDLLEHDGDAFALGDVGADSESGFGKDFIGVRLSRSSIDIHANDVGGLAADSTPCSPIADCE
jgi:hypothetical protein